MFFLPFFQKTIAFFALSYYNERKARETNIMNGTIYKFEKEMLRGGSIQVTKKFDDCWYKKHWHNYYELVHFCGCEGHCTLNGEELPIRDRCLFLLTPKDFHEIHTEKREGAYALIIAFSGRIADPGVLESITKAPLVSYSVPTPLSEKLDELYASFTSNSPNRSLYVKHLFNCILLDTLDVSDKVDASCRELNPIVRESLSIMLSDPTAELSLELFAKKFNVTSPYFSRLFHEDTGVTFKRYLTSLRLEYAKQLLEENVLSIIDVGYECGFNTPSQFYRAFKAETGSTPSAYRKGRAERGK